MALTGKVSIVSLIHDKSLKHLQTHLRNLSNLHDDTVNNILSETAEPIENSLINNFYFHSNKQVKNNVIINIFGRLYSSSINCLTLTKTFLQLYFDIYLYFCLLYTSPSPRDGLLSRMPSSA